MINRKFDLDRNYRYTAEILRAAHAFSVPAGSGMQGVLALPVEPDTAIAMLWPLLGTLMGKTYGPSFGSPQDVPSAFQSLLTALCVTTLV